MPKTKTQEKERKEAGFPKSQSRVKSKSKETKQYQNKRNNF